MRNHKWVKHSLQAGAIILTALLIFGCAGAKARKQSFSSFVFYAADNPSLDKDVVGAVDWRAKIITLVVPPGTSVRSLIATYMAPEDATVYVRSQGSTVAQSNGATANDFRRPVPYLLVFDDGNEVEFAVKVREAETNPNLSSLTLGDNVAFSPAFSTEVEEYSAEVPYAIADLVIRPNAESQYASITIDGKTYGARNASAAVPLRAGEINGISIVVTAEDGVSTRTYTLKVKRAEPDRNSSLADLEVSEGATLTPEFDTNITGYRINVPYEPELLTFIPSTGSPVATVTVQGKPVASGSESQQIELGDELVSAVEIVVTAQDGVTNSTYTVTVQRAEPDRDSGLASIGLNEGASIAPNFSKNITAYEVSIPNTMDTVVLTPQASSPVARMSLADKAVESGSPLDPIVLPEESSIEMDIVVTAQDRKTETTYHLVVTRRPIDASWTQAVANAGFSGRFGFEAISFKGRLWVIAGSASNLEYSNDIWYSEDGVTWTKATENPGFAPRRNHQVVEYKGQLWLIGGETGMYEYENDVWTSKDGVYWTQVQVSEPFPKRVNHQAAVFQGKMWVIGGYGSNSTGHSVWSSKDGKVWSEEIHEAAFPPRDMHQLVVFKGKMWIIAGQKGSTRFADVWASSDGVNWTLAADPAAEGFSARMLHEAAVYAGRMWVTGGYTQGYGAANDVWYSKDGVEWKLATESADFVGRIGHQMVNFKGKFWIIGGTDNKVSRSDVWYSNAQAEPENDENE